MSANELIKPNNVDPSENTKTDSSDEFNKVYDKIKNLISI